MYSDKIWHVGIDQGSTVSRKIWPRVVKGVGGSGDCMWACCQFCSG